MKTFFKIAGLGILGFEVWRVYENKVLYAGSGVNNLGAEDVIGGAVGVGLLYWGFKK